MPSWLKRLFPSRNRNPFIRFIAAMESGLLVDELAEIIQTQVVAHRARASIRNRPAVPIYELLEEGRMPVFRESALIETGEAVAPGESSRYVLEDAPALWRGFKAGAIEVPGLNKLKKNSVQIAALSVGALVFIGCLWVAAQPDERPAATPAQASAPAQTQAEPEGDFGHGLVEPSGAGGEEGTGTAGEERTDGAGGEGGSGPPAGAVPQPVGGPGDDPGADADQPAPGDS